MSNFYHFVRALAIVFALAFPSWAETDLLLSWNDGAAKQAIVTVVKETTNEASPKFVPPTERIAVFDNNGTFWPENPTSFQLAYTTGTLKQIASDKPEIKEDPMIHPAREYAYDAHPKSSGKLAEAFQDAPQRGVCPIMTALIFNHQGYEIVTTAWSAASKNGSSVTISYVWGPAFGDASISTSRLTLDMTMAEFTQRVTRGGVVDLRSRQ